MHNNKQNLKVWITLADWREDNDIVKENSDFAKMFF